MVTPRSGGVAILFGAAAGLLTNPRFIPDLWPVLVCAGGIAAIGLIDDVRSLRPQLRLAVQILLASGFVVSIGWPSIGGFDQWAVLVGFGAVVWLTGLTNAYNFMDGINGIASVEAIICGAALAILFLRQGDLPAAAVAASVGGAALGFLPWNFPVARIFMGDVASGFLGFVLGALVVRYGWGGGSVIAAALPLVPFIADTAFTFVRRLAKRENVLMAHRSHFYQRLTISGASHFQVTVIWGLLAAVGAVVALLYERLPAATRAAAITAYLLLHAGVGVAITIRERQKLDRGESR